MIEAAARGDQRQRDAFARSYLDVVRVYLKARWKTAQLYRQIDDAVQDVFVECFRDDGPLQKAERASIGGFRPFFFGVIRNVARRIEKQVATGKQVKDLGIELDDLPGDTPELAKALDQAWAQALMQQAAELQKFRAQENGDDAIRRVELLKLRFQHRMPIRDIAAHWNVDPTHLHREYAKARNEFKKALAEIVAFHLPNSKEAVEQECRSLLTALGQ